MEFEEITALEFLHTARAAASNSAVRPAFRMLSEQLETSQHVRQRLVFELLLMASRLLLTRMDPAEPILWIAKWRTSVLVERIPEYAALLEKVIVDYFDYLPRTPSSSGVHPWVLTLAVALGAVRGAERDRFQTLIQSLRDRCKSSHTDFRSKILAEAEMMLKMMLNESE